MRLSFSRCSSQSGSHAPGSTLRPQAKPSARHTHVSGSTSSDLRSETVDGVSARRTSQEVTYWLRFVKAWSAREHRGYPRKHPGEFRLPLTTYSMRGSGERKPAALPRASRHNGP